MVQNALQSMWSDAKSCDRFVLFGLGQSIPKRVNHFDNEKTGLNMIVLGLDLNSV